MCGIVGYIGNRSVLPVLMDGLKKLEYRGYDSAGIALLEGDRIHISKTKGKVQDLQKMVQGLTSQAKIGIAHTRWATHGEPNSINAHPHTDGSGDIALVHNGIIENFTSLKSYSLTGAIVSRAIPTPRCWPISSRNTEATACWKPSRSVSWRYWAPTA